MLIRGVASLTLTLARGSQLPIALSGNGTAVMAGNAVWSEDEVVMP